MVVRKMKEKCKDAARMRREKERAEFVELAKLLPLPSSTTSQLDKASIIRLTSSYLRMRNAFPEGLGENWGNDLSHKATANNNKNLAAKSIIVDSASQNRNQQQQQLQARLHQPQQVRELGSLILQTLDGFVFALHKDGKIMYISETASVHLGLPQIDLTGSSIFEYIHSIDHNDIYETLTLSEPDRAKLRFGLRERTAMGDGEQTFELARSFCIRMKCILPKRNAGLVSSGYKAIHCNGYLKVRLTTSPTGEYDWEPSALVAVGHSLLPSASTEVKLNSSSFMFRTSLDMKLYYIESAATRLLGFDQSEMVGQSLYQFVHVQDVGAIESSHKALLEKGQMVSRYYRLMRKEGGFLWVQSLACLASNPKNLPKPQHIIGTCFILGLDELDGSFITSPSMSTYSKNLLESISDREESIKSILPASWPVKLKKQEPHQKRDKSSKQVTSLVHQSNNISYQEEAHHKPIEISTESVEAATSSIIYSPSFLQQSHYQCQCCPGLTQAVATFDKRHTTGPTRRASDDSCSVVSSVASTSFSNNSNTSSGQYQADGYANSYFNASDLQPVATESTGSTISNDESMAESEPIIFPIAACNNMQQQSNYQTHDLWFTTTNNTYQQYHSLVAPSTGYHYAEEHLSNNYTNLTINHYQNQLGTNHYHQHQMVVNNDFTISTV